LSSVLDAVLKGYQQRKEKGEEYKRAPNFILHHIIIYNYNSLENL
jgi:hypothetical protein